jgi:hypothetical protein
MLAWLGPDVEEFKRILEGKAKLAQGYGLTETPLWLLVVCEVFGDLESHVFPQSEADVVALAATLRETGFDFDGGPFAEVWLFSAFTDTRRRLHPPTA